MSMPLWFYLFTPFGWLNFYFILGTIMHEAGHFVIGLLTGHKITKFKIGLCDPLIQFQIKGTLFEFSIDGMGGRIECDNTQHVSQLGIFLTAMAGPAGTLLFATSVFSLIPISLNQIYEPDMWRFYCQMIIFTLSMTTFVLGLVGIIEEFKNILIRE